MLIHLKWLRIEIAFDIFIANGSDDDDDESRKPHNYALKANEEREKGNEKFM